MLFRSQLGKNAKDAVIELCGGVGKILVETKSGNAALSIQSEYVDIKGVHESVLETSSSSAPQLTVKRYASFKRSRAPVFKNFSLTYHECLSFWKRKVESRHVNLTETKNKKR